MNTATASAPTFADMTATLNRARALVRDSGARVTEPRVAVLAALIAAARPLSHPEVLEALGSAAQDFDRVTLYRVLDWLTAQDLAHKLAGEDRVFRFAVTRRDAGGPPAHGSHSHFHCSRCHKVYCLATQTRLPAALPAGFRGEQVEVTVRGLCSDCNAARAPAGADSSPDHQDAQRS